MSKATKEAKRQAPKMRKVRRGARRLGRTPNPAFKNPPFDMADAVFDMTLMEIMRTTGMRDALKKIIMGGGSVTVETDGGSVTVETDGTNSPDPQAVQSVGVVSEGAD